MAYTLVVPAVAYTPVVPAVAYTPVVPAVAYTPVVPAVAYTPVVPAVAYTPTSNKVTEFSGEVMDTSIAAILPESQLGSRMSNHMNVIVVTPIGSKSLTQLNT